MNLTIEKINDFSVVNIEGRVDASNSSELEKEIDQLFGKGVKNIIFNCSGLKYISSSGLRIFLVAQKKIMALHGKLHLCNMQPAIKEIFDISGFSNIFKIINSLEEALRE